MAGRWTWVELKDDLTASLLQARLIELGLPISVKVAGLLRDFCLMRVKGEGAAVVAVRPAGNGCVAQPSVRRTRQPRPRRRTYQPNKPAVLTAMSSSALQLPGLASTSRRSNNASAEARCLHP